MPVVIAALSTLFFTILVLMSSFVTTYFMGDDDEYTYTIWYPYEVFRGLVRMTLGILVDDRMLDATGMRSRTGMPRVIEPRKPPSLLQRLFTRFLPMHLLRLHQ